MNTLNKRMHSSEIRVVVKVVYPILVRVRAYWRFRYGKWEHVCAHYRRYWGIKRNEDEAKPLRSHPADGLQGA